MSEHEPEWMRDKRLRDEEARMVQLENNVIATKNQVDAIRELFEDERKSRRRAEERLEEHEQSDNTKFASIDTRLMGMQVQLASINDTGKSTESIVKAFEPRLKALEDANLGHTAVQRFLANAWAQMALGAGLMGSIVAIYTAMT